MTKWYEDTVYIKMSDCPEIQEQRQWEYYNQDLGKTTRKGNFEYGDYYLLDGELHVLGHTIYPPSETKVHGKDQSMVGYDEGDGGRFDKLIWLPTQSDLQGMLNRSNDRFLLVSDFQHWVSENYADYYSMEQLWIAFVMKEKWNKDWDGERWEND